MDSRVLYQDIAIEHGVNTMIANGKLYYLDESREWVDVTYYTLQQITDWLEQH